MRKTSKAYLVRKPSATDTLSKRDFYYIIYKLCSDSDSAMLRTAYETQARYKGYNEKVLCAVLNDYGFKITEEDIRRISNRSRRAGK